MKNIRVNSYRIASTIFPRIKKYDEIFWEEYDLIERARGWGKTELEEYQLEQLRHLVKYAYEKTPFYKRIFDEYGIVPKDIQSFDDYKKIPVIRKADVVEYLEEIRALPKRRCVSVTTGGSTGTITKIYINPQVNRMKRQAYVWHSFHEGGYYFGDKIGILRGKVLGDRNIQYDPGEKIMYFNSMKMTEKNIKLYLEEMQRAKIKHLRAYPSAAEMLAKYIEETGMHFNEDGVLKTVFTSSETLLPNTRRLIEKNMHVKVVDLYGNSEQIGFIAQCKSGHYHEYMTHSYLEYEPVNDKYHNIIGTGFINNAFPLLRYSTEDLAVLSEQTGCCCGKKGKQIKRVAGRWAQKNLIIGREGNKMNLTAVNTHADIFKNIYKIQFVQKEQGRMILNVMPKKEYSDRDRQNVYKEFSARLGPTFELEIRETNDFIYTHRGKSKLLVQELDLD